jgi:hypothetical protein
VKVVRKDEQVVGVEQAGIEDWETRTARHAARFRERMNPLGKVVDFGEVRTSGSLRVAKAGDGLVVQPFPPYVAFDVALNVGRLLGPTPAGAVYRVTGLDTAGRPTGEVPSQLRDGWLQFRTGAPKAAKYLLRRAER